MSKHTLEELKQWRSLPLSIKVSMTKERIRNWVNEYGEDGVSISFSGGKDSTVLLDIVHNLCGYDRIPAVFVDVPTQYPELRKFAESKDNVAILRPKMNFMQVCEIYGFPLISKEVSETVYGARRYLTKYIESVQSLQTDRQTDRQTCRMHNSIVSCADKESIEKQTRGGADRKYRKLRGLAEFSGKNCGRKHICIGQQNIDYVGETSEELWGDEKGEYP